MALGCTTVSQDRLQAPPLIRCLSLFFRREDRSHAMGNNTSFSHFLVTSKLFLQILTSKIQFIKGADRWKIEILQLIDTLIQEGRSRSDAKRMAHKRILPKYRSSIPRRWRAFSASSWRSVLATNTNSDQSWLLIALYLSATSFVSLAKPCPWRPSAVCKSTWKRE